MEIEKIQDCLSAWDIDYGVPVQDSDFYLSWENPQLIKVCQQYGTKYRIRPVIGTAVALDKLTNEQMIVNGDSKYYHFILTNK